MFNLYVGVNMNEEGQIGEGSPGEDTGQGDWSQQPQQQEPPQGYQQGPSAPPQHQAPPKQDTFKGLSRNSTLTTVVILGLVILMVGAILISAAPFGEGDTVQNVTNVGNILQDIGVFLVAGFMLIASIYRDDWPKWMRIGTLTFGLLLILVAWFGFLAPLFQFG